MPADVEVTAIHDGQRYTLAIPAMESLYRAIFYYNHIVISGNPKPDYPPPTLDTVFEVRRVGSDEVLVRTFKQAMDWGNRESARGWKNQRR